MFLFAAFLLEPALTFLFDLLVFVILVFDTMITLLYLKNFNFLFKSTRSRTKFLPTKGQVVKVLLANSLITIAPNALSVCNNVKEEPKFINLSIGEYRKLPTNGLANYATSNKELVSIKHYAAKASLIVRAKHQGFSSLKVWSKDGSVLEYNIFIHTKIQASKIRMTRLKLERIGLKTSIIDSTISACGDLNKLKDIKHLHNILKNKDSTIEIDNQVRLSNQLQKEIANMIYGKLLQKKITTAFCKFEQIPIKCKIPKSNFDLKSLTDYWLSEIPLELIQTDETDLLPNFKLKTRLILLESASSEVMSLGLDKISSKFYSLIKNDLNAFIGNNLIFFGDKSIKLSSIATPEILTRVNHKGEISIGSEIPFTQKTNDDYSTNWKFAGLKILTKVEKENDQFFLNIETELSRPVSSSNTSTISSNKTKSRIQININESLKIVDIGHQGIQTEDNSLPYLSEIPILGKLFSSTSEIESFKNIKIFVQLERMP